MVLARVCPWCRRTERWRQRCGCLPSAPPIPLTRPIAGVDAAHALHRYEGPTQRFLLAAKNGGRRDILIHFGRQLADLLTTSPSVPAGWLDRPPTVVWIPASTERRRRRGYDQGRLLARAVGHSLGLPVRPILGRVGAEGQEGRSRVERLRGPGLRCRIIRAPADVVLIDDVITTGSSLAVAAETLRQAGSSTIIAVAVASAG